MQSTPSGSHPEPVGPSPAAGGGAPTLGTGGPSWGVAIVIGLVMAALAAAVTWGITAAGDDEVETVSPATGQGGDAEPSSQDGTDDGQEETAGDEPESDGGAGPITSQGFATPEEATEAYLNAMFALDLDALLAASSVELAAQNHQLDLMIERVDAYSPTLPAPGDVEAYRAFNEAQFTQDHLGSIRNIVYSLLAGLDEDSALETFREPEEIQLILDGITDPGRLADSQLLLIGFPERMADQTAIDVYRQQAAPFQGDEMVERVVLIAFEGQTYLVGVTAIRFGDRWLVHQPTAALAGINSIGSPRAMTEAEFRAEFELV